MSLNRVSEPTTRRVVVAVADIAGFLKAVEHRSDLEAFRMLDEFCELVGEVVTSAGGTVVKFIGDAALIAFPEEDARQAVAALRELASRAQTSWSTFDATCAVRIKAHLGPVVCGPLGTAQDKRFDIIGNTVNELFMMPQDQEFTVSEELERITG